MAETDSIRRVVVTRKEARALGLVRYFTGKPCPSGHISERFVSYGQCVDCTVTSRDRWYERNKDRALARNSAWHQANPGRKRERNAKYRAAHPEKVREAIKAHYLANPEKYAAYRSARRARKRAAPGDGFTKGDIQKLCEAQRWRCTACGFKKALTVDHVIPLAKGGANDASNLQMLCKSCNSSKGAKDPYEFAASLGKLL